VHPFLIIDHGFHRLSVVLEILDGGVLSHLHGVLIIAVVVKATLILVDHRLDESPELVLVHVDLEEAHESSGRKKAASSAAVFRDKSPLR